jgi:hypothetical protein
MVFIGKPRPVRWSGLFYKKGWFFYKLVAEARRQLVPALSAAAGVVLDQEGALQLARGDALDGLGEFPDDLNGSLGSVLVLRGEQGSFPHVLPLQLQRFGEPLAIEQRQVHRITDASRICVQRMQLCVRGLAVAPLFGEALHRLAAVRCVPITPDREVTGDPVRAACDQSLRGHSELRETEGRAPDRSARTT